MYKINGSEVSITKLRKVRCNGMVYRTVYTDKYTTIVYVFYIANTIEVPLSSPIILAHVSLLRKLLPLFALSESFYISLSL